MKTLRNLWELADFHSFRPGGNSVKFLSMMKLRMVWFCLLLVMTSNRGHAAFASGAEKKRYETAYEAFRLGFWERAETEFAAFTQEFPKSEQVHQAVLLQAEAAYRQSKFTAVESVLRPRLAEAAGLEDQFLFWIGSAQLQSTNYPAAAATFGRLAREFPASTNRLEASVDEAEAVAKQGQWTNVVDLLKRADGPFRQAETSARGSEMAARGYLLLAEAQLSLGQLTDAEVTLELPRITNSLSSDLDWRRRSLLCHALAAHGKLEKAAEESVGLVTAAENTRRIDWTAESVAFRASLLEQLQQYDQAIATLRRNLTNSPVARQREALTRLVALEIRQGNIPDATRTLESYLNQTTNPPAADVAWLTLGELHLKQHVGRLGEADTNASPVNHLAVATNCFGKVINNFPGNAYIGKAQLDLGWCGWVETNYAGSEAAFAAAVHRLPPESEDQAVARFKLADAQYQQSNYVSAVTNYRSVLQLITNLPNGGALRTPASYQTLRAILALSTEQSATNLADAEEAMRGILAADAQSSESPSGILLVAQAYADAHSTADAQRLCDEFLQRYPQSDLRPEVELLGARMREAKEDWSAVVQVYDSWLQRFPTNRLRPQVEFQHALATARSGAETNALNLFTNFVAQFPTNPLAPRAQWWVADFYFGRGAFAEAEIQYKQLFQNWKNSDLAYEARMMAGRAAFQWKSYANAMEHFTGLVGDTNCPVALRVQGLFAYGGVAMKMAPATTNKWERLEQARQAFNVIVSDYPTNDLVPEAWGEIGNCSLQLAAGDAVNYGIASNAFQHAVSSSNAPVATRSQALDGLAVVFEKQAALHPGTEEATNLLKRARDAYLDVYWGQQWEGKPPDAYWKKRAGSEAARLSAVLGEWPQALAIYRDMLRLRLVASDQVDKKIAEAEKMVSSGTK